MRKSLMIFVLLITAIHLKACCGAPRLSLTELMLSQDDERSLFIAVVDSSWMEARGGFLSTATIEKAYKNAPTDQKTTIRSGNYNSSIGGRNMKKGWKYFIASTQWNGGFSAFGCDHISHVVYTGTGDYNKDYLAIVEHYFGKVQQEYTGQMILKNKNGKILAQGILKKGKPDGEWFHYEYPTMGDLKGEQLLRSRENYKEGHLDGEVTRYFPKYNFQHKEVFFYKNGLLQNHLLYDKRKTTNVLIAERHYTTFQGFKIVKEVARYNKDTLRYETQRIIFPNTIRNGLYHLRGSFHGPVKYYYKNGQLKSEGVYWWGAKIGKWRYYFEDGLLDKENYNEKPERPKDIFVSYFPDGSIEQEGKFEKGNLVGEWKHYSKHGNILKRLFFKNGMLDGAAELFRENGIIYQRVYFKDGLENGANCSFAADGKTKTIDGNKQQGHWTGKHLEYYPDGNQKSVGKYKNNLLEGFYESFHKNGKLDKRCEYRQGMFHNDFIQFDEAGLLIEKGKYFMGRKIGQWRKYNKSKDCFRISEYGQKIVPQFHYQKTLSTFYEDRSGNLLTNEEIKIRRTVKRERN